MNTKITPERLKKLAEALGKKAHIELKNCWINKWENFIPDKDWRQCGELLEWLQNQKDNLSVDLLLDNKEYFCDINFYDKNGEVDTAQGSGATSMIAIVLAALEFIEMRRSSDEMD